MLKEEREKKGMTITELAEKSKVCRDIINKIENQGYTKAKKITRYRLANALEVDVEKIC